MSSRIGTIVFATSLAALAACSAGPASAQSDPQPTTAATPTAALPTASARAATYAALPQGSAFTSRGERFAVLPDVRALPAGRALPQDREVLERKGRFVLYREARESMKHRRPMMVPDAASDTSGPAEAATDAAATPVMTYAVALNQRTGRSGVVLGTIAVKLADFAQTEAVASTHRLTVEGRFDALGVAYLRVAPGEDIAAVTEALRADTRVVSADPEILEAARIPQ
jgi:hypothetical protein